MQHSTATSFFLAFALHLLPTYALPPNEHQSSSLNPYDLDLDLPFIGQSDPQNPAFPLLIVDAQTAKSHPDLPPAVRLVNDICTPYQPIFNSSKATIQLSTGLKAYNRSNDSMGTMQFDIFSSANCSNSTLIDTIWPKGDTIFTRITKEQEARMYHMKSVRVRTSKGKTEGATPASWNETAVICNDEKMPCVKRNETSNNGPDLPKRSDKEGRMAQYGTTDCAKTPLVDGLPQDAGLPDLPSGYHIYSLIPPLYKGYCTPWYPIFNQTAGPGLGINFGTGSEKVNELHIFKFNDQCESDMKTDIEPDSCCDAKNGGLLGIIYEDGTADFGAENNFGIKDGMCASLGPGSDQTLWQMRYFKAM